MEEQYYEYRTGRTSPKKNHSGPIAVLLILVIFLGGLVSALGLLNIHLFRLLDADKQEESPPLSFSKADAALSDQPTADGNKALELEGMTVQELSTLYQQMYDLPQGLYISHVAPGSDAEKLGIAPGDVLTCFDGTPVSQIDTLKSLLKSQKAGDQVALTTCRDGQQNQFTLTFKDE